ncbi:DNA fragmentation factor subunit alpha-like isoform X1 [Myzus persicae]|uniref:DNA fragmentation factor subunit alpha-like isoform X1 n=1 Tax=Myzus persicae TaxID=13164 RepID=UPI000B93981C|nr:DNA fragmentation factor subunit alpha-like isoform X1 [Myzus persicae]
MASEEYTGKPYKIIDSKREHKIGIVATSLSDFMTKAQQKLDINENEPIKVVLESDGTEIDEEDYFDTLETNTLIMILKSDQKWSPYDISGGVFRAYTTSFKFSDDQIDGTQSLNSLIRRLQNDIGQIAFLSGCDLELLSDMDPDSLVDMAFDRSFLDQVKEASGRFLYEKREAQDAINLLKLYHATTIGQNASKKSKV